MKKNIIFVVVLLFLFFLFSEYSKAKKTKNYEIEESKSKIITLNNGNYEFLPSSSKINWEGSSLVKNHKGTIEFSNGSIKALDGVVSGSLVLNMNTISGDAGASLDNHLKSLDFFNVEEYPLALFDFNQLEDGSFESFLTIKGIKNKVSMSPKFTEHNDQLKLTTSLVFDRTKWGINFKSESALGTLKDKAINDDINIDVNLILRRKKTA